MMISTSLSISVRRILLGFIFALSLGVLLQYLYFSSYGVDFTDEGFYFNWYKYPDSYPAILTFFGFVYSLPYRLFGENIVALRAFNLLSILSAGAWCVCQSTARMHGSHEFLSRPLFKVIFIFSLSTISLVSVSSLVSPSYDHLAFIGCLFVAGALLKSGPLEEEPQVASFSFGFPFFFGILVASLGKPTTGVVLGLICLVFALTLGKRSKRLMVFWLICAFLATLTISILFVGGVSELFERVSLALSWGEVLGGNHDAKGLIGSIIRMLESYPPLLITSLFLVLQAFPFCILLRGDKKRIHALQLLFILLPLLSFAFVVVVNKYFYVQRFPLGFIWASVIPFALLLVLLINRGSFLCDISTKAALMTVLAVLRLLLVLIIPFAFAFGTNSSLWIKILQCSILYVSAATYLIAKFPVHYRHGAFLIFLAYIAIGQVLLIPVHSNFNYKPYRQPGPLSYNNSPTRIGSSTQFMLSAEFSDYIQNAKAALLRNGFKPGDPILDLSGQSPGLIYAVNGRAIGQAWIIGGYKGSSILASAILNRIPCHDLHSSWVIIEPDGPRSIDLSVLKPFEIEIQDQSQYEKVAELATPVGAGGYDYERRQIIYKPLVDAVNSSKCILLN